MSCLTVIFLLYFFYQLFFYFIALTGFKGNELKRRVDFRPIHNILVIIPAHNEENVIANLINDLWCQRYYKDYQLYIVVIADHCTDKTIQICNGLNHPNLVVHERNVGIPGKQFALKEFFAKYKNQSIWDSFCVLDADNRIDDNFISEIVYSLEHHNVVQAYLDVVKSSYFVSKGYEVNYRIMNGTLQRARQLFGLTAFLGGTGWAARWSVVEFVSFSCESVVDDLEYTILLWLYGYRVEYLQDVKICDEKPRRIKASYVQRLRWMRGGFQVLFKYFRPIIFQGFVFHRISFLDLVGALSLYVFGAINCIFLIMSIFGIGSFHFSLMSYLSFQAIYLGMYLLIDSLSPFFLILSLPAAILVNIVSIPLGLHGLLTWRKKSWVRTQHYGEGI